MNADTIFGTNEALGGALERWWDKEFGTPKGELKGGFREVVGYVQREFGKSKTWAIREVRDVFKAYSLIQNNWDAYKDFARDHWGENLSKQDLEVMAQGIDGLMNFLTKKYGSTEDAKAEIIESIKSLSFEKYKRENYDAWKKAESDVNSIEEEAKKMLREVKHALDNLGNEIQGAADKAGVDVHHVVNHIKRKADEAATKAEFETKKAIHEGKEQVKKAERNA